jgi:hypothetical protein
MNAPRLAASHAERGRVSPIISARPATVHEKKKHGYAHVAAPELRIEVQSFGLGSLLLGILR